MNVRTGALRLWVVVSILWIGLVGWTEFDRVTASVAFVLHPPFRQHYSDWVGDRRVVDHNDCIKAGDACKSKPDPNGEWVDVDPGDPQPLDEVLPSAAERALSLPLGSLAIAFVGAWVWRGFRPQVSGGR